VCSGIHRLLFPLLICHMLAVMRGKTSVTLTKQHSNLLDQIARSTERMRVIGMLLCQSVWITKTLPESALAAVHNLSFRGAEQIEVDNVGE